MALAALLSLDLASIKEITHGKFKRGPRWGFAGCGIRPFLVAGYGIGSKIVAGFGIQISAGCGICHKIIAGFEIQISRGNFHLNLNVREIAELTPKI